MREKFSVPELTVLKSELLQGFDSKDATELVQMFLAGHGYGVSAEEARNAVAKVGLTDAPWKRSKESWRALLW